MKKHLIEKKQYYNRDNTKIAVITNTENYIYYNRNYYYECDIVDTATAEVIGSKQIQYSNLKRGNFAIDNRTEQEKKIDGILNNKFSHSKDRKANNKSYKNVILAFIDADDFREWGRQMLQDNPQIIDDFLAGKMVLDKDLLSFLKHGYIKKEYSRDTCLFVKRDDNLYIKTITNDKNMTDAEKEALLRDILFAYGYDR